MSDTALDVSVNRRRIYRHWREKFDFKIDFVFIKRTKIGLDGFPAVVLPGDEMSPELKARLGKAKVKSLWDARMIGGREMAEKMGFKITVPVVVEQTAQPEPEKPCEPEPVAEEPKPKGTVHSMGKGWFKVVFESGEEKLVRGKAAADALVN